MISSERKMDKLSYSIEQAVDVSSIGRSRLFKLMKDGKLSYTKVGRRTIIPAEAL